MISARCNHNNTNGAKVKANQEMTMLIGAGVTNCNSKVQVQFRFYNRLHRASVSI